MTDTTIDAAEVDKFGRLAAEWWDPNGKLKPLHQINPVRLGFIREHALRRFARDGASRRPLEGLSVLDIGCGGGLLCEPLARLGARVVGIDPAGDNVRVAAAHAAEAGLEIDYRATTAEALAATGERFDIVLAMEVVEHVDNVPLFMKSCADLVKPGGLLGLATINRTTRAFALAIVGAEYVLGWLPRGTHEYHRFLTPKELSVLVRRNGLAVNDRAGVSYFPLAGEWRRTDDLGVNYMLMAERAEA